MNSLENAAAAYIGTGIMGSAMARNLLRAGTPVVVHNRTASKAEALVTEGATIASSPVEAVESLTRDASPRVMFVNVPDTPDVDQVLFGKGGVTEASPEALNGLIIVDHSTICPVSTKRFAERIAEDGVAMVDAPVSGGDVGAQKGTLTIMCGGEQAAYDAVLPLLKIVGGAVTHLGPAGSGQVCKACNQIAGMTALAGTCEALALAKRSGLDLGKVIEVVSGGAAASWQLANLGPKIAAGDHAPGVHDRPVAEGPPAGRRRRGRVEPANAGDRAGAFAIPVRSGRRPRPQGDAGAGERL